MRQALFVLALLCGSALAAPTLTAALYETPPAGIVFTIDGGTPQACTLAQVTGGWQPRCDLAGITQPGTYTLVMTATNNAECVNTPNAATCSGAGSASSAPFAYKWRGSSVPVPVLSVAP